MAQFTEQDRKDLQETRDAMRELKVVLLGKNGSDGLCHRVDNHAKRIRVIELCGVAILASGGGFALVSKVIGG